MPEFPQEHDMNPLSRRSTLLLGTCSVTACALPVREPAVPRSLSDRATVLGLPNERFLIGGGYASITQEYMAALARRRAFLGLASDAVNPPLDLLAISGGGEDGAFGAGLLNGWTVEGSRPVFNLVTGVSTGALTAPFAFIGSSADAALKQVYTGVTFADVATMRNFTAVIFNDALSDTAPLLATISRQLDDAMLAAIAQGYREGRLLLIGTTNLDTQLPVIWNIGAIANSGDPRAAGVIRRILLASAAIPGFFPPVLFDVEVDGRRYQELHVDGGAVAQAFLYPTAVAEQRRARLRAGRPAPPVRAWLIRNARLDANWASTNRRTLPIAQRAISTMTAVSGYNDAVRIWLNAERDGIDFRMAYIGSEFTIAYDRPFDQTYMTPLFQYGFDKARFGYPWSRQPPFTA
ncbi:patatin-like phospholipase family protein [Roseomonas sp. NAR14]|uniref:Patatin-like phospholipase family protein n=1 Tax=Roseomonas acroporae TaxID=2937791 RepID=A0A9X1YE69_9PROT|nr:patatin-like phospholipase family protein [Roseomonas acroporae]MCK8787400.1 patatin-like phospholipase family protein [Roseomonas acroporae]